MSAQTMTELDRPYALTKDQIAQFREQGFIKLKQVLSPGEIAFYGDRITRKVVELNTEHLPLEKRDTYSRAFLQVMNIWRHDENVREFVFSKRLARIAAELLGVAGVRLYHDQALYKESGGGHTPWHVDQAYWPLDSDKTITLWAPLQATPLTMGPLAFGAGSQHVTEHRNLRISDESERLIQQAINEGPYDHVESPFDLGEVSYHYGWTYHRAGGNSSGEARKVMTVIYMDKDIRIKDSAEKENDWETWCDRTPEGDICAGSLNPVLYP